MRKVFALLAALLLIMALPATALAEGDGADASAEPAISFSIDNESIYTGMDKAYKDGYIPTVKDGTATIILPLLASGDLKGGMITVTPGLGDTASSPFVYKNYQKTVSLQNNPVGDGSQSVSSYLVVFQLSLASGRVNGIYPVSIDVQAQTVDGTPVQQAFTCYVTITDGKNPSTESSGIVEKPQSQPKIIVSGYHVSSSPVEAGSEFTATVTLKNTNEKKYVKNMTVTATCDSTNLVLLDDSNVIYIDKLDKGHTTDIQLRYKTDLETAPQRYTISLAMEYDNSDATTLASTGLVMVEVVQPLRVEMEVPQVEEQVNAGDTMPLTFQVMNFSRGAIYNVRVELSAPGLIPTGTAFVGNMEAGTSATADMDVFVGTKNMSEGYEGDDKYGYTSGTFKLIYEDGKGQEYTEEADFGTTISEPVIAASNPEEEEKPETAGQWWISIVIGGAFVAALAIFLALRAKRKGKENEDI
jgi:hypothetical protein